MVYFGGFFAKLGYFAGFFYLSFAGRNSEAVIGRGHYIFRVPNSLQGSDGWGKGRGTLYIKASLVPWKDIRLWQPQFGPEKKENHFVSGNFAGFSMYILSEVSAKLRWVGRVAHLGRGVAAGCSVAR